MISICIIMKNEERHIDKCLQKIKPLGYEIVIVDTGSTDKSKKIALKYTDKVFDFEWINNFSAARNFAAEKATNDIIFALDSDEFIEEIDSQSVEALILKNKDYIFCPLRINKFKRDSQEYNEHERISRIYSKSLYHYTGKIHEQVVRFDKKTPKHIDVPISMIHVGYSGNFEERVKKARRNEVLLLNELSENGEDPYIRYQLGKAYYMQKKLYEAISEFEKCLELSPDLKFEYVNDDIQSYCYCLLSTKQYSKALEILNKYDRIYNNADFEFLAGFILMNNGMLADAVIRFLKATECKKFKIEGTNSFNAFYNIGVIFECCNQYETAKEYYEKCGNYKPALDRLNGLNR